MLLHQSKRLSRAFSDEQDKLNVIRFCISSISILKIIWDSSINIDALYIGRILFKNNDLKNIFSNNGEKISSYRWFSPLCHTWLRVQSSVGFTGKSESHGQEPSRSKGWHYFAFSEKICFCSVKQSNQSFCIMKYSFYHHWHFRQSCPMSIVVLMLTSKPQLIERDSAGLKCLTGSPFSALRSTRIIFVQACPGEIRCGHETRIDLDIFFCFNKKCLNSSRCVRLTFFKKRINTFLLN